MSYPSRNNSTYTAPTKNSSSETFPDRNTSTYTAPSKNSSTANNDSISGQNFLMIDNTFFLLLDTVNKLLIEPLTTDWSYSSKS